MTFEIGDILKIQLIRNATMRIDYDDKMILTDPFLGPKFSVESFAGISENPLVDLPILPQEVIDRTSNTYKEIYTRLTGEDV